MFKPYSYMAPAVEGDDLPGTEAELAKLRGDELDDLEEETDEEREARELAEAASKDDDKDDEDDAKDDKKASKKDDAKDDEDDAPAKKDDAKKVIPKARFDELRTKSKTQIEALNKQLEELRKKSVDDTRIGDTKKTETAIEALEKEAEALLTDGKTAEGMAKLREVRILERSLATAAAEFASEKARATAVEQGRLDLMVERLEQNYPQINPDADEYDQDIVDEVMELKGAFEKAGKSSSEALSKAVKYVFADKIAEKDEKAKAKDEDDDEEKDDKKKDDKSKEKDRKKQAVERNAKDAKKLPAKTADHGVDSDKKGGGITSKSVLSMTEEEFEALPESTKARLRGDVLED